MMGGGKSETDFEIPKFFERPPAFQPAPLSNKEGIGGTATIEDLDVCEGEGLPPITDEYLSGACRAVILDRVEMDIYTMADTDQLFFLEARKKDPSIDVKRWGYGDWDYAVAFFAPNDPPPEYAFTPKTDDQLRRVLAAKNNFRMMTKGGVVELKLCRSEDKNNIWVYERNNILEDHFTFLDRKPVLRPDSLPKIPALWFHHFAEKTDIRRALGERLYTYLLNGGYARDDHVSYRELAEIAEIDGHSKGFFTRLFFGLDDEQKATVQTTLTTMQTLTYYGEYLLEQSGAVYNIHLYLDPTSSFVEIQIRKNNRRPTVIRREGMVENPAEIPASLTQLIFFLLKSALPDSEGRFKKTFKELIR